MVTITAGAAGRRMGSSGSAFACGLSVIVHALALLWIWHAWPSRPLDRDMTPRRQIEVRLVPLAVQAPQPAPVSVTRHMRPVPEDSPMPRQAARRTATHAAPALPVVVDIPASATMAAPEAGPEAASPAFDMKAALATARQVAREDGMGRKAEFAPEPGGRIQDKLEHARRADCRTINAQSMNLLASAFVVAANIAKNAIDESGCKW